MENADIFTIIFDRVGFTYVLIKKFQDFQISKNHQDPTIGHFFENDRKANCFGPTIFWKKLNIRPAFLMSGRVKQIGNFGFC